MHTPRVDLALTTPGDRAPIANLYPSYLHDIAGYESTTPNAHGVLSDDDALRTWDEVFEGQAEWWRRPGVLFPYLIRAEQRPAGFAFVASGPYAEPSGVDFVMWEFFVAHGWRGRGVAEAAVREAVARHAGRWQVMTWPTAPRALAFWRRVLPDVAGGALDETRADTEWGERVVFRFEA